MSNKKQIEVTVERDVYCEDKLTISDFQKTITMAVNNGATHVNIYSNEGWEDVNIRFYYLREETDGELTTRLHREKWEQERQEQTERKRYEELKKKFEPSAKTDQS